MLRLWLLVSLAGASMLAAEENPPELACYDTNSSFSRLPRLDLAPFEGTIDGAREWLFGNVTVYVAAGSVLEESSFAPGGAVHELELTVRVSGDPERWYRLRAQDPLASDVLRIVADHEAARVLRVDPTTPLFFVEYPAYWSGRTPWGVTHQLVLDLRREPRVLASLECYSLEGGQGACGSIDAQHGARSVTTCEWSASDSDYICDEYWIVRTLRGPRTVRRQFFLATADTIPMDVEYGDIAALARAIDAESSVGAEPRSVSGYGKLRLVARTDDFSLFEGPIPGSAFTPPFYVVRSDGATSSPPAELDEKTPMHDPPPILYALVHDDGNVAIFKVITVETFEEPMIGDRQKARSLFYVGVERQPAFVDVYFVATTASEYGQCGSVRRPPVAVHVDEDWASARATMEVEPEAWFGSRSDEPDDPESRCSASIELRWESGMGFAQRTLERCVHRGEPRSVVIHDDGSLSTH